MYRSRFTIITIGHSRKSPKNFSFKKNKTGDFEKIMAPAKHIVKKNYVNKKLYRYT